MEPVCPIDAQFRDQIDTLLKPPSPGHEYFDQLIESSQRLGLKIKTNGEHGKGELVLKDQMLVGAQHTSNKIDCLVCDFCFRFIGSIELQIGRKLYIGLLTGNESNRQKFSHTSKDCNEFDSSDGEDKSDLYCQSLAECASSSSNMKSPLDQEVIESLVNEKLVLPYSKCFPLPSVVSCPGGCKEASYCCISCAEADWNSSHSLLCTGERSKSVCKEALHKFIQHANETNDIFLLAAKVISSTILRYRKLKVACQQEQGKQATPDVLENCDLSLLLEAWKPFSMGHKR
ncbi:hypothetical protein RJ639_031566, partial [Escallonia herrerae]